MKEHLEESIKLDQEEDMELGEESGNNSTDHFELIPLMEQVQFNLTSMGVEIPVNCQVSADNGYSTDENTEYLDKHWFNEYILSQKLSRKEKKRNLSEKPFSKDNFNYDYEMMTYICPLGQPLYKKSEYQYKNKTRITY